MDQERSHTPSSAEEFGSERRMPEAPSSSGLSSNESPSVSQVEPQQQQGLPTSNSLPFFADATLDLSEAHDIADTPEPRKLVIDGPADAMGLLEMPPLDTDNNYTKNTTTDYWNRQIPERMASPNPRSQASSPTPQTASSNMARITSADHGGNNIQHVASHRPPRRAPRRPRDLPWAMAFLLLVPTSLVWTMSMKNNNNNADDNDTSSQAAPNYVFYCILLAYAATLVLSRLLYLAPGGGDGDDGRHAAAQVLLAFCPLSVAAYPLLLLVMYWKTPSACLKYGWIVVLVGAREVAWALRHFATRQTFFAALTKMALDMLSRSLRRRSFARCVGMVVGLQLVTVMWWKLAVFGALGNNNNGVVPFLCALLAGKWATGTVARLLGLVASGGITSWFAQQSDIMMERIKNEQEQAPPTPNNNMTMSAEGSASDDASADYNVAGYSMPEEYSSAAASAYQSVLDMEDEGIDDDDDVNFEENDDFNVGRRVHQQTNHEANRSTVKALLFQGLTVSFGSVAQCGLLGGLAQFVWTVVRNVDAASNAVSRRFPSTTTARFGFRGMQVGGGGGGLDETSMVWKVVQYLSVSARSFVRGHSDLAMSHVAAYYKSYQRAARDVAILVDASGVEPIIHDDITTKICGSVCGTLSSLIVILGGIMLSHHRSEHTTDDSIVQSMILAFLFCYVLIFTVMEPLRASIKASYVCFAQHPESLSQAFPLIYHRLSRISEANVA